MEKRFREFTRLTKWSLDPKGLRIPIWYESIKRFAHSQKCIIGYGFALDSLGRNILVKKKKVQLIIFG